MPTPATYIPNPSEHMDTVTHFSAALCFIAAKSSMSAQLALPSFSDMLNWVEIQQNAPNQTSHESNNNFGPVHPTTYHSVPYQTKGEITTTQSYRVPVDTESVSKAANEKRKRNAAASRRFRKKRKAKENQLQAEIERLKTEAKNWKDVAEHLQAFIKSPNVGRPDLMKKERLPQPGCKYPRTLLQSNIVNRTWPNSINYQAIALPTAICGKDSATVRELGKDM